MVTKTPRETPFFLLEDLEGRGLIEKISVWGILERRELVKGIPLLLCMKLYNSQAHL